MTYFYPYDDKEAVKAFVYEDLKNLGIKVPKLEKITKAHRNSISQNHEGGGGVVFGVPLPFIPSIEDQNIGYIPKFLIHVRNYLRNHLSREGIFRRTGSVARQKDLAQHLENHGGEHLEDAQVNDVTSVIKQFYREMPEPLIPHILQEGFVKCVQLNTEDSKAYSLSLMCLLMPLEHLSVFRYMLEILHEVTQLSMENKMDAHNLAVCLAPNFFQTKQSSKFVHQQTEAIELCIRNSNTIGVVPPSISERVVMLRSLEGHNDQMVVGSNSSIDCSTTSSSGSIRKKKRSGSLHGSFSAGRGLVGSIRRSVDKLISRTSRRSASVPDSLNIMNDTDEYGYMGSAPQYDSECVTPQIVRKAGMSAVTGGDIQSITGGISAMKRKAIISKTQGLLSTPYSAKPPKGRALSCDDVFDSPPKKQSTEANDETSLSMSSTNNSKLGTPNKKRGWGVLRSPFSKRKRSLSAGPSLSPSSANSSLRLRSSSKTKKLIRRLSGGKAKAQLSNTVGLRLAYSTAAMDDSGIRQRTPSMPETLLSQSVIPSEAADVEVSNEELVRNLKRDLMMTKSSAENIQTGQFDDLGEEDIPSTSNQVSRIQTMREQRRDQVLTRPVRRRAKSADSRPLKRGRPNHITTGLQAMRLVSDTPTAGADNNSTSSLASSISQQQTQAPSELSSDNVKDSSTTLHTLTDEQLSRQPTLREPGERSDSIQSEDSNYDTTFDRRMKIVSDKHSTIFSSTSADNLPAVRKSQTISQHSLPQRSATFSHSASQRSVDGEIRRESRSRKRNADVFAKPPLPEKRLNSAESSVDEVSSYGTPEQQETAPDSRTETLEARIVIGGNETPSSAGLSDDLSMSKSSDMSHTHHPHLAVRSAALVKTHHDSITNLSSAKHVNQVKRTFDRSAESTDRVQDKPPTPASVQRLPTRNCPVRIPTVFAKNDPRAMRYKMAADAVRRRSLQREESESSSPVRRSHRLQQTGSPSSSSSPVQSPSRRRQSPKATSTLRHRAQLSGSRSLRQCSSPPVNKTPSSSRRVSIRQRTAGAPSASAAGTLRASIPISTELVRTVPKPVTPVRESLREQSPNIYNISKQRPQSTPKIKSALIPLDNIRPPSAKVGGSGEPVPQ